LAVFGVNRIDILVFFLAYWPVFAVNFNHLFQTNVLSACVVSLCYLFDA